MKTRLASVLVAVLLVVVGLLALGVSHRMANLAASVDAVAPPAEVSPARPKEGSAQAPLAVFIGDFTEGSDYGGEGANNWTAVLAADLRRTMPLRTVVETDGGGSGYVLRGTTPIFADQVRRLVTWDAEVVTISGSRNDVVAAPVQVMSAALETFDLVHALAPRAKLIVIGPTWGKNEPTDKILQTRDAVRDAAIASGAQFVDPIEGRWFTNGEPDLIGDDDVHPTNLAHVRIAENLYPILGSALTNGPQK